MRTSPQLQWDKHMNNRNIRQCSISQTNLILVSTSTTYMPPPTFFLTSYSEEVDISFHCPLNISLKMMHYYFANIKDHKFNNKVCKGWTHFLKPWRFLWLSAAEDIVGRRSLESRWNAISREDDQYKPGPGKTEEKDVVNIQGRFKNDKKNKFTKKTWAFFSVKRNDTDKLLTFLKTDKSHSENHTAIRTRADYLWITVGVWNGFSPGQQTSTHSSVLIITTHTRLINKSIHPSRGNHTRAVALKKRLLF